MEVYSMKKTEQGFALIGALLIVAVLVVVGGVGYVTLQRTSKKSANNNVATVSDASGNVAPIGANPTLNAAIPLGTSTPIVPPAPDGTTQSIDNLTQQDAVIESTVDTSQANSDQTDVKVTSEDALNVEGAYNDTAL
ncbi:MAG: hypothetical protein NVS1B7_5090 [Candidatus Saccharimonadales bacterium]